MQLLYQNSNNSNSNNSKIIAVNNNNYNNLLIIKWWKYSNIKFVTFKKFPKTYFPTFYIMDSLTST